MNSQPIAHTSSGAGVIWFTVVQLPVLAMLVALHGATLAWGDDAPLDRHAETEPVNRAIAYLSTEITTWNQEHTCFSCHHSGDAIRALMAARRRGFPVDSQEIGRTIAWLRQPQGWAKNGPDGEFNDRRLASLQFSAALAAAESERESGHRPLLDAGKLLTRDIQADGSWPSEQVGTIGSPITYGPFLAAVQARNVLRQAGLPRFAAEVDRTNQWLREAKPKSVLNAAAVLWGLAGDQHDDAAATRRRCLDLIRAGQSRDGGWGPYVTAATEPFDTAVVMLALDATGATGTQAMIRGGRDFLVTRQLPDGSWPETTRPADRESYAHRVSTTAWCLQALLISSGKSTR